MANTQVGIYNYRHCIESHIPSLGSQRIVDALAQRLNDSHYINRLRGVFPEVLVMNALACVIKWNESSRSFNRFTASEQRCIWNAYCLAMWDIGALKNCNTEPGYIRYHLVEEEIVDEQDLWREHEITAETDSWSDGTDGNSTFERPQVHW